MEVLLVTTTAAAAVFTQLAAAAAPARLEIEEKAAGYTARTAQSGECFFCKSTRRKKKKGDKRTVECCF